MLCSLTFVSLSPKSQIFPQAPELPHLYHFTSNDVDCIFANQFPTKSSAPDRAAFFALLQRWSRSMNDWVGTLAIRTEHYAAQKYPFVIADRCWEACQSFFGYCDGELAKIVNHTHWRNYLELERVGNGPSPLIPLLPYVSWGADYIYKF